MLQLALDGEVDGLVVADLEMQEGVVLDAAPVAAVEGVGADEVDRAGDVAAAAAGHDQEDVVGHALADQREECRRLR
jgi:inorganic pyrophosphatase